jgi:hypothetical protein
MKKLIIVMVLFGTINILNAKTTSLYEHARNLRIASQKERLKREEPKKPVITEKILKDIKYTKD